MPRARASSRDRARLTLAAAGAGIVAVLAGVGWSSTRLGEYSVMSMGHVVDGRGGAAGIGVEPPPRRWDGRGVQPSHGRHARELRVRQALRDDDERDAQPGDDIAGMDADASPLRGADGVRARQRPTPSVTSRARWRASSTGRAPSRARRSLRVSPFTYGMT